MAYRRKVNKIIFLFFYLLKLGHYSTIGKFTHALSGFWTHNLTLHPFLLKWYVIWATNLWSKLSHQRTYNKYTLFIILISLIWCDGPTLVGPLIFKPHFFDCLSGPVFKTTIIALACAELLDIFLGILLLSPFNNWCAFFE